MSGPDAGDRSDRLRRDIGEGRPPFDFPAQQERQGHRRIEMGARDGAEDGDQHHQGRAGREGVAEQSDGHIAAREPFAHDPRPDDHRQQQSRSQALCRQPPDQVEALERRLQAAAVRLRLAHAGAGASSTAPMSSMRRCSDNLSMLDRGRFTKRPRRLSR